MAIAVRAARALAALLGLCGAALGSTGAPAFRESSVRAYRNAAESGDGAAQKALAFLLLDGGAVPRDPAAAIRWLSMVAARGDTDAKVALADIYREGRGVDPDRRLAMRWYREAMPGSPYAAWRLAELLEQVDSAESARLYEHAAEAGFAAAQNGLGNLFVAGIGVERNYAKAREWYRKAASNGFADALLNLAGMYYLGLGVEQNYPEALELVKAAAQRHARDAEAFRAQMERDGRGRPSPSQPTP